MRDPDVPPPVGQAVMGRPLRFRTDAGEEVTMWDRRGARPLARAIAATLVLSLLVLAGCSTLEQDLGLDGQTASSEEYTGAPGAVERAATDEALAPDVVTDPATGDVSDLPAEDRLIVRTKTLRLEVDAVHDAIDDIQALVDKHGGVVTAQQVANDSESPIYRYDEATYTDSGPLVGYVTVRVPVADFNAFVNEASDVGEVLFQAETSDDVTQQHVDLSARLENLRAEEQRLREFFDAADTVEDMLAIERELSRVRGEIESLDAQVSYLERQAAMATVTIELSEPKPIVRPSGNDWGFADAITTGFRGAAGVIKVLITFLIAVSPLLAIAIALFFAIRAIVRARSKRRRASADAVSRDA